MDEPIINPSDDELWIPAMELRQRFKELFPRFAAPTMNDCREKIRDALSKGYAVLLPDGRLQMTSAGHERARQLRFRLWQKQN